MTVTHTHTHTETETEADTHTHTQRQTDTHTHTELSTLFPFLLPPFLSSSPLTICVSESCVSFASVFLDREDDFLTGELSLLPPPPPPGLLALGGL